MRALAVFAALAACGTHGPAAPAIAPPKPPATALDRMLSLLPDGAQIVVELDLARLRANAVVGEVAAHALAELGADARLPGLPISIAGSPLGNADAVVLAAYGVGTAQAATVTLLATHDEVPSAVRIDAGVVAIGPEAWTAQLQARAAIAAAHGGALEASAALMKLRDRAMPVGATGAVVRITARLAFDARISLERQTGLDTAPAELSLWADVADDVAIVMDADAADPGDAPGEKDATKRLAHAIRTAFAQLADVPAIHSLGVANSLADARLIAKGTWVRAIVSVGPHHLLRVIERARAMMAPS
jgi:hypothetical protein